MSELKDIIDRIASGAAQPQIRCARAVETDAQNKRMLAVRVCDELELYDVALGMGAITVYPKSGASCIVGVLEGAQAETFLIAASEIERIEIQSDTLSIGNGDITLTGLFAELTDLIRTKLKVYTPAGPSGNVLPDTLLALDEFENHFKTLLKDN